MDLSNPAQRRIFFEIHAGLPRQSAGSESSTLRAGGLVVFNEPVWLVAEADRGLWKCIAKFQH